MLYDFTTRRLVGTSGLEKSDIGLSKTGNGCLLLPKTEKGSIRTLSYANHLVVDV